MGEHDLSYANHAVVVGGVGVGLDQGLGTLWLEVGSFVEAELFFGGLVGHAALAGMVVFGLLVSDGFFGELIEVGVEADAPVGEEVGEAVGRVIAAEVPLANLGDGFMDIDAGPFFDGMARNNVTFQGIEKVAQEMSVEVK